MTARAQHAQGLGTSVAPTPRRVASATPSRAAAVGAKRGTAPRAPQRTSRDGRQQGPNTHSAAEGRGDVALREAARAVLKALKSRPFLMRLRMGFHSQI